MKQPNGIIETFAFLVSLAKKSGLSEEEAKREAKAVLNCIANAAEKFK